MQARLNVNFKKQGYRRCRQGLVLACALFVVVSGNLYAGDQSAGADTARESQGKSEGMQVTTTFAIQSWQEEPYREFEDGRKLTEVNATKTYAGDIQGSGSLRYLMAYGPGGTATFVGFERITGRIGDDSGSVTLKHVGQFAGAAANIDWTVLSRLGTGALSNLTGDGSFTVGHGREHEVTFELYRD